MGLTRAFCCVKLRAFQEYIDVNLLDVKISDAIVSPGQARLTPMQGVNAVPEERKHWKNLFEEIVSSEICCSCSACVVACPHKVLELHDFDPIMIDLNSPLDLSLI